MLLVSPISQRRVSPSEYVAHNYFTVLIFNVTTGWVSLIGIARI